MAVEYLPMETPMQEILLNILELMLQKGLDVNKSYKYGDTMLHYATSFENKKLVDIIFTQPLIKINNLNNYGETALHKAARIGSIYFASLFVKHGADCAIESPHGTAYQISKKFHPENTDLHQILDSTTHARSSTSTSSVIASLFQRENPLTRSTTTFPSFSTDNGDNSSTVNSDKFTDISSIENEEKQEILVEKKYLQYFIYFYIYIYFLIILFIFILFIF